MILIFNILVIFTTKVYIETYSDTTKALSMTKLNSGNTVFDFQSIRRKEMNGIYCVSPIIVPISNVDYRFYYCGELMCLKNGKLGVCHKVNDKTSFNIVRVGEYFTIRQNGLCFHVYKGNIFLRKCDRTATEQFFNFEPVRVPMGDNIDIEYDRREASGGIKEIEFDKAMRQLSKIHHSEYIEDLFRKKNDIFTNVF